MNFYDPAVESHLDNVFKESAKQWEKETKGKIQEYTISGMGYTAENFEKGSGKCIILSIDYNRNLDCDVITFKDINTGETREICQFEVTFKEET